MKMQRKFSVNVRGSFIDTAVAITSANYSPTYQPVTLRFIQDGKLPSGANIACRMELTRDEARLLGQRLLEAADAEVYQVPK